MIKVWVTYGSDYSSFWYFQDKPGLRLGRNGLLAHLVSIYLIGTNKVQLGVQETWMGWRTFLLLQVLELSVP